MAELPATVVVFDDAVLERMVLAVEQVRERLKRATAALNQAGVRYAVVGGNAVAAWVSRVDAGAARNTVDVDLMVRREDFEKVQQTLEDAGFLYSFTYGVHLFVDGPQGKAREGIHVLFANEKVKPDSVAPSPDLTEVEPHENHVVLNLEPLVRMKLTAFRDKDRTHLRDLIEVGLVDHSWPARFPPELASRLQELLDDPEG